MDQLRSGLVMVMGNIAPGISHGKTGLPGILHRMHRDLLLRSSVVLILTRDTPVHDDKTGLVAPGHARDPGHIDILVVGNILLPVYAGIDSGERSHPAS